MPQPVEAASHMLERFLHYLESHGDERGALAAATEDLRSCAREINAIGCAVPIFDVLDHARFTQTVTDPNTYQESSHRGSLPLLEFVALTLTAQPSVDDARRESTQIEQPAEAVQMALELGGDIADLVVVRRLLSAIDDGDSRDVLAFIASQRETFVRSPTYEHIAERTLDLLFGDPQMDALCSAHLGFTARQACDLFGAIDRRTSRSIAEYVSRRRRFGLLTESHPGFPRFALEDTPDPESIPAPVMALVGDAFEKLWFPIPNESTFVPSDLVAATGLPVHCVERFLSTFTYVPPLADAGDLILEATSGPSPLRTCPILVDDQGRRFLVHFGIDMYAIREAIEERLKNSPDWNIYDRRRARYLEDDSLHLLRRMLPTADAHAQLEYYGPDPDKSEAAGSPQNYSRKFESDALLILDDVALIVESKAGAIRPHARGGQGRALEQDLQKLVTNASNQAKRLHDLIVKDHGVHLLDRSWLDLSGVRRVHSVVVTLEDLSGLATTASELIARNLLSPDHVPWLVSLYDLNVVSDIVQSPAEFVLFLQRRTNPEIARRYHAFDELDYFMAFLEGGLRGEDEPVQSVFEVPEAGRISPSAEGVTDAEPINMLGSHTDPLDAWYMYTHGNRTEPAPRPEYKAEPKIRQIVDSLAAAGRPGWLSIGAALLDRDSADQKRIVESIDEALERTRDDGMNHTACVVGSGPAAETSTLVFSIAQDASNADAEMDGLVGYVTAKKHQTQSAIGAGLMFDLTEPNVPKRSFYDNRTPAPDSELDQLVETYNLQPLDTSES